VEVMVITFNLHLLAAVAALATAICSGFAAWYWYESSQQDAVLVESPTPSIDDAPQVHQLSTQVNVFKLQAALSESSRLNKTAAKWSALAAACATITAILSAF